MDIPRVIVIGCALVVVALFSSAAAYAATSEEQQLKTEQQRIDAAANTKAPRPETLATEFGVSPQTVTNLRNQKRGWGSITIELAMAQQLTRTDPATYPTMDSALAKIEAMYADGRGWGRIANDLGFKLGPVVSSVQHARHDVVPGAGAHNAAVTKGRPDHATRPERMTRVERPVRHEPPRRPGR
jgi:hypothetical protein